MMDKAKEFVAEKFENIKTPEASVTDVDVKRVGFGSIDYHAKVSVNNPYPISLPICEINYVLKSHGRLMASGTIPDPGHLKAKDTTMLDVPAKVPHNILVTLVMDIAADWDIDYELDLGLVVHLPLVGNVTIPVSTKGEIKLPTICDLWKK